MCWCVILSCVVHVYPIEFCEVAHVDRFSVSFFVPFSSRHFCFESVVSFLFILPKFCFSVTRTTVVD